MLLVHLAALNLPSLPFGDWMERKYDLSSELFYYKERLSKNDWAVTGEEILVAVQIQETENMDNECIVNGG